MAAGVWYPVSRMSGPALVRSDARSSPGKMRASWARSRLTLPVRVGDQVRAATGEDLEVGDGSVAGV
jgi:hypothetical protein